MTLYTGGGGGKPTYLKIKSSAKTRLFSWYDGTTRFYTISENPSVNEPLYNNSGTQLTGYKLCGKKGTTIIIKNTSTGTKTEATRDGNYKTVDDSISTPVFYKNGGGGSGADGEMWVNAPNQNVRRGGSGGGYFWLDTSNLNFYSIDGRDAGSNANSNNTDLFPNVHSGKGGPSGTGNGSTIVVQKPAYKTGSGASGANGAANSSGSELTAYYGSGGGGAGGDEDASGGKAGTGSSTYEANTTGENGSNYHTTPTESTNYLRKPSTLGQGGNHFTGTPANTNGKNGWLFLYKFEKEYETFDMGKIGGETPESIIDAGQTSDTNITRTINAGDITDTNVTLLNAGNVLNVSTWRDCGKIGTIQSGALVEDTIVETIKLGNI